MKKTQRTEGKKLALNVATVRHLQENLSPEQLQNVVGGHECAASASGSRANC